MSEDTLDLGPSESLVRQANARAMAPPSRLLGDGRLYLTNERMIWIGRGLPFSRKSRRVEISLQSIRKMRLSRFLQRGNLAIYTPDGTYSFEPGKGPFPFYFFTATASEEWKDAIDVQRAHKTAWPGYAKGSAAEGDESEASVISSARRLLRRWMVLLIVASVFTLTVFLALGVPATAMALVLLALTSAWLVTAGVVWYSYQRLRGRRGTEEN